MAKSNYWIEHFGGKLWSVALLGKLDNVIRPKRERADDIFSDRVKYTVIK